VLISGCSESTALSGAFYPVKGQVILPDGKPLTSGSIIFTGAVNSVTTAAPLGSDGRFELKGSRDGLPEGLYRVSLDPAVVSTVAPKRSKGRQKFSGPYNQKYLDEEASQLTATVKADASANDFTFNLTK
jgi:hypothetical protein